MTMTSAATLLRPLTRPLLRAARFLNDWIHAPLPCRVCGARTVRRAAYRRVFNQCCECDFIFAITYDEQESRDGMGLDGSWTGFGGGGFREYYLARQMVEVLALPRVLLFGTGNTPTFAQLLEEGVEVSGCDISQDVVRMKQQLFGAARFMTPAQLPGAASFDAIVAVEVIEHLLAPATTFAQLFSLLRPGGVICGTTDCWPGGSLVDGNRPGYMSHLAHVAYWCERSLRRIADNYGYSVALHEMVRPGSVLPDQRFGQLWPNKRVFFLFDKSVHGAYFDNLRVRQPVLPIDRP